MSPTVQLDQILSTFDPATRRAFETWMQQDGIALTNRGQEFNAALAELYPFATNVDSVLAVLNRDSAATSTLLHDGGQVFSAISPVAGGASAVDRQRQRRVLGHGRAGRRPRRDDSGVPGVPARDQDDDRPGGALRADDQAARRRAASGRRAVIPALESLVVLAPELKSLLVNIGPLTHASKAGVPALERFLDDSVPLLTGLTPYLGGLVPVIDYINTYRREVAAFFANSTAASEATLPANSGHGLLHYVRISNPINPETLTDYSHRLSSNRGNPYLVPNGAQQLLAGLPVFGGYLCTSNPPPAIGPTIPASLAAVLSSVYYTSDPGGPPCKAQPSLGEATTGQLQAFPQLQPTP